MIDLIVILDPHYADPLQQAARTAPAWVVATPANMDACQELWNVQQSNDHREKGAVTCFDVSDPEDRITNLLDILPTLAEHHGEIRGAQSSFPNGFVLEVIGLAATDRLIDALRDYGFSSFREMPARFRASMHEEH